MFLVPDVCFLIGFWIHLLRFWIDMEPSFEDVLLLCLKHGKSICTQRLFFVPPVSIAMIPQIDCICCGGWLGI